MFTPHDHLIQLPRRERDRATGEYRTVYDDYLEVKWRLVWFRERYPRGTIVTEELCVDLDREYTQTSEKKTKTARGYARFRATVSTGEGATATGTGTETAVNFADFVEKAETRAIGRALAALGIGTQFVGEELSEGEHLCDAPVSVSTLPQSPQPPRVDEPRKEPLAAERKATKKREAPTALQATLIGAIASELLVQTCDGETRWKPGAKAHCERVFGTLKWRDVKALPLEHLQAGYVELRKILDGLGASTVPAAHGKSQAPAALPLTTPPPTGQAPAALTPEQEALKQEAVGWGIQREEIDHILRRYDVTVARNLLWQGRELRRQKQVTPLLAAPVNV